VHDTSLGGVSDIIQNPTREATLGVAGLKGAVFLKADNTVLSRVVFERTTQPGIMSLFRFPVVPTHIQFVDIDGHGNWEFLNRGGVGWRDASLIGKDGRTRWIYGGEPGLDDMTAGDLDADGIPDFVAAFNGDGGVRRLDQNAKLLWKKPDGNIWHVEIVDVDADGKPEIVHTSANGDFTIRDRQGTVIRQMSPGFYCSDFSLCHWPSAKSGPKILALHGGGLCLVDFQGGIAGRYPLPAQKRCQEFRGVMMHLKPDEQEFLAVLTVDGNLFLPSSTLFVFNAGRELVYQEALAAQCASLLVRPGDTPGCDELLVGGMSKVWKFSPAKRDQPKPPAR